MGAYAPVAAMSQQRVDEIVRLIVTPTLNELKRRHIDYRGVLYAGLMVGPLGPKLLEYNVRFGDPEAQVLVPLYGEGLYDLLLRAGEGRLGGTSVVSTGAAVTVILASAGYPQRPRTGEVIHGLGPDGQLATPLENVIVFHAGTTRNDEGQFVTSGGRVLAVTGLGTDVAEARRRAYEGASLVTFRGSLRRSDIARRASEGVT
jgi:phosphoribosylamine--glycine ligase